MDSNDFIFSDDVAESLGFRMADADNAARSAESGNPAVGSSRADCAAIAASASPLSAA